MPGVGSFSGDFTTNLAQQCRAFSRALKIEKLKAPLFRGPEGAGATNDWCINYNAPVISNPISLQYLHISTYVRVPVNYDPTTEKAWLDLGDFFFISWFTTQIFAF